MHTLRTFGTALSEGASRASMETLAPVCSLTRQPACHLPAGEHDRARPCWIRRCGALAWGHVGRHRLTRLLPPPISKTLQIAAV